MKTYSVTSLKCQLALIILVSFIFSSSLTANTIHVPDDQPTIQAAIDIAVDGDTVLVAQGIYYENINFIGKNIVVASQYILDNNLFKIFSTIINGGDPVHPDTASCVRFISGEDSTAMLIGFTLTGGTGTIWPDIHVGGKYREGGGILIEFSSPTIKHNLIMDNEAIDKSGTGVVSAGGGAIRSGDGNPRILNNTIRDNRGLYGAGIVLNYSGGIIKNNLIYQNTGGEDFSGSGIWCYNNGPAPKIYENNTIVENHSSGGGQYGGKGGALMVWSTLVTVRNNIIWGNTQSTGGPIALISGTVDMTYSDIEGGWTGEGNIDLDPEFTGLDYYLEGSSPCIDSGDPDPVYNDPEDPNNPGFALFPARIGLRNDMGAYGGPLSVILPIAVIPGVFNNEEGLNKITLEQNYPNPVKNSTEFRYSVKIPGVVNLTIYNMDGQRIQTLVNEFKTPGSYNVNYNCSSLTKGIYIYKLQSNGQMLAKKMIVAD